MGEPMKTFYIVMFIVGVVLSILKIWDVYMDIMDKKNFTKNFTLYLIYAYITSVIYMQTIY